MFVVAIIERNHQFDVRSIRCARRLLWFAPLGSRDPVAVNSERAFGKGRTLGEIFSPKPVVLIVAVSTRYDSALTWARDALQAEYGELFLASDPFDFTQTTYYTESMGMDLKKQLIAHAKTVDPAVLPDVKLQTNELEDLYRRQNEHPEQRPLNLDPGYISEGKLVLASTKNHSHRIYLRDGIYAEITLHFHKKAWQAREWTYPDYKQPCFHAFFDECRQYLRQQIGKRAVN